MEHHFKYDYLIKDNIKTGVTQQIFFLYQAGPFQFLNWLWKKLKHLNKKIIGVTKISAKNWYKTIFFVSDTLHWKIGPAKNTHVTHSNNHVPLSHYQFENLNYILQLKYILHFEMV